MMINLAEFGTRLRDLRKQIGLSQREVGRMANVTNQAVSKWENGAALPDIDTLLNLGELFGTSIETLLTGRPKDVHQDDDRFASLIAMMEDTEGLTKPFAALSRYFDREELFETIRYFKDERIRLNLRIEVANACLESTSLVHRDIPLDDVSWGTLSDIGPALYDMLITFLKKTNHDIAKIVQLLKCPRCGMDLTISESRTTMSCPERHNHGILEQVAYFGTREDPGNSWSFCYTTYDQYVSAKNNGNNRLSRSTDAQDGFPEMFEMLRVARYERILEIGTGEGTWIEYLLANVDWPCCIMLTDLSHRILKYNRRYLSERYYSPYVSLIYLACDARTLPLKSESVDCVTSWGGFENMGADYDKGLQESFRVLKEGGSAIYLATACDAQSSKLVERWVTLLKREGVYEMTRTMICDKKMWQEKNARTGFTTFGYQKIKDEQEAPDTEEFPYENEIMQWMGSAIIKATK
jgi:ubiquinone/menaquinone biosynthesis C-methylase UbiE/transcriptional regulator with XRE-family HTH domain